MKQIEESKSKIVKIILKLFQIELVLMKGFSGGNTSNIKQEFPHPRLLDVSILVPRTVENGELSAWSLGHRPLCSLPFKPLHKNDRMSVVPDTQLELLTLLL